MNKSRYQLPLYCHNLVERWLNRLPMTLKLPISSKDDSNIDGSSSVSSSEDDCNTMGVCFGLGPGTIGMNMLGRLLYP